MAFEYGTGCLFIPLHLHSHLFMVPSQTAPSSHHLNLKHHMEDRLFSFIQNRPTFVGQHEIIPIKFTMPTYSNHLWLNALWDRRTVCIGCRSHINGEITFLSNVNTDT